MSEQTPENGITFDVSIVAAVDVAVLSEAQRRLIADRIAAAKAAAEAVLFGTGRPAATLPLQEVAIAIARQWRTVRLQALDNALALALGTETVTTDERHAQIGVLTNDLNQLLTLLEGSSQ